MSTGSAGRPSANSSTQAAVFGPTPGRPRSHARASSSGSSSRNARFQSGARSRTASRMRWMRGPFCCASPPDWIVAISSSSGASATASQLG